MERTVKAFSRNFEVSAYAAPPASIVLTSGTPTWDLRRYRSLIKQEPAFASTLKHGEGFVEIVRIILEKPTKAGFFR
jgi:hypothetical protein